MQDNVSRKSPVKRYATTAIVLGSSAVIAGGAIASSHNAGKNYGIPFNYGGQQYYVQQNSRRAVYPNKEACMKDVPVSRQSECEPMNSYYAGRSGYYGPLYTPNSGGYQPGSNYKTEPVTSSNFGKKFPSTANANGFGENGKAFTGSKGS